MGSESFGVISSYVHHKDSGRWWNVSTIDRECSSLRAHGSRYLETIVWTWDRETRERGEMLYCRGSSLPDHFNICRDLIKHGTIIEEADDGA